MRYLGIDFYVVIDKILDYNCDGIVDKGKLQMISWFITVLGRVTVAKLLMLSQFNHLFLSIPDPSAKLKTIEVKFFNFIWKNKPEKMCRKKKKGDLRCQISSCLTWFRRMVFRNIFNDVNH